MQSNLLCFCLNEQLEMNESFSSTAAGFHEYRWKNVKVASSRLQIITFSKDVEKDKVHLKIRIYFKYLVKSITSQLLELLLT